jgi:hypothetical protein
MRYFSATSRQRAAAIAVLALTATAGASGVSVHSGRRYFQDANGHPLFLIGYYGWAAVPDGYFIDHPARYAQMIRRAAECGVNYIRISLGVNRFTASTSPPSWDARPTPTPFAYVHGKADLDRWDPVFWRGLREQCALARKNGVFVHLSLFDGVELRGGPEAYRYANSFWNPANQARRFYEDPDADGDGNVEEAREFYQAGALRTGTGIGKYQRKLIAKAVQETAPFDNVFYEIGNEMLSSPMDWNAAVVDEVRSLTSRAVTQCGGQMAPNADGWSQHRAGKPQEVKANVAEIVGRGRPAWEDPDGPALSDRDVSPDDLRRAAWNAFAGGAAAWGGFSVDFWKDGRGFQARTAEYYRNLRRFLNASRAPFWNMKPRPDLVTDGGANSCLADDASIRIVYVAHDPQVTLDLGDASARWTVRLYDPRAGSWSDRPAVNGGGKATIGKPPGADDWVLLAQRRDSPS